MLIDVFELKYFDDLRVPAHESSLQYRLMGVKVDACTSRESVKQFLHLIRIASERKHHR